MANVQELKEAFVALYQDKIKREGADKLLEYLLSPSSDFFVAPASARFHSSYEGGLCEHSMNVYHCLKGYLDSAHCREQLGLSYSDESMAIVALLHDLCKINVYTYSCFHRRFNIILQIIYLLLD